MDGSGELHVPFHRTLTGQAIASVGSGIFHVYSGGIVIDTLKTRLQNGQTLRQALLVTGRENTRASALVQRYARRQGAGNGAGWLAMVRRSNLTAGHLVTAAGRFPYLFLNLGTYSQAEQWCLRRGGGENRPLTVLEDMFCINIASLISSFSLTMTECPKVLDQLRAQSGEKVPASAGRTTIMSVIRQQGLLRVLQGYDASYIREVGFSLVFLGAPGIAMSVLPKLGDQWLDVDGAPSRAGLLLISVPLGMTAGFMTNSVDQLKTRIQFGQFKHLGTAFRWQAKSKAEGGGGGLGKLFGRAAMIRACYIGHGCMALNFARFEIERIIRLYTGE